MAKIKYDVSDVEPGVDYDTPIPRGVYRCKIADITVGESKSSGNPMITVEYEVLEKGDWKGRKLWDYIVLNDASAWKLRQFTDAVGVKAKGELDTDKLVGEIVMIKVKHETDDRDPENPVVRARVGNVTGLPEDEDVDEEDDAEEEETEEEEEEEPDDDDDDDEEEEELESREDLDEYDRDDLEALIEEEELEVERTKRTKLTVLRDRVWEALDLGEEGEEKEDEEEAPEYDDMNITELTAMLKERGLSTKTKMKGNRKKALFVKRLEKDDEDEDGNEPF